MFGISLLIGIFLQVLIPCKLAPNLNKPPIHYSHLLPMKNFDHPWKELFLCNEKGTLENQLICTSVKSKPVLHECKVVGKRTLEKICCTVCDHEYT